MSIYSSVEEELWRIFTFYGMHSDPTVPDVWNRANFVRFAKDCQIVSKKLNATAVELEITRLSRLKIGMDQGSNISITFTDFLNLLDALSLKVYPRDAPEIAVKRLILENVLLLANRRIVSTETYNLDNSEALKVINEQFVKSITKIFEYYVDLADKRRNQAVTVEKMKLKDASVAPNKDSDLSNKNQTLKELKDFTKSQKNLISYKEYIQFCHDFNLKATALLTAIQVGEIFLNIVPFNFELKAVNGMSFEMFTQALLALAAVAYRECSPSVPAADKVKALLLYMWKAVNDNDNKTVRKITSTRANAVASYAGSLNLFGSGPFSDQFLSSWVKDGFRDYTVLLDHDVKADGVKMVKKLVGVAAESDKSHSQSSDLLDDNEQLESSGHNSPAPLRTRTASSASRSSMRNGPEAGKDSLVKEALQKGSFLRSKQRKTLDFTTPHHVLVHSNSFHKRRKLKGPMRLMGADLQQLLLIKPELTEFLFLEIQNMKLDESVNNLTRTH